MEATVLSENFCDLNDSELLNYEGGGPAGQFLSIVGVGLAPAVIAAAPWIGLGLLGASITEYIINYK